MALAILMPGRDTTKLVRQLKQIEPDIDVRVWPDIGDEADIVYAILWKHPPGALSGFPNLGTVSSFGAGVDFILADPDLPAGVTVTRVVDDKLIHDMMLYTVSVVLERKRCLMAYRDLQNQGQWKPLPEADIETIGILGLGHIGGRMARGFADLGFRVLGWDRQSKKVDGVETFASHQMDDMLGQADCLICCLPLTDETRGILNADLFGKMKRGAFLINVARGGHLKEEDLIAVLDSGHLSGACLDVFSQEPLPADHPFWTHPKITITPHIAGITDPESAVRQLHENYRRTQSGQPLLNPVDRNLGF